MAGITLTGELKKIGATEKVNETFTKREAWLEIDQDTQYPQTIAIEFVKDKTSLMDKFSVGDKIEADINIRGNVVKLKSSGEERCFNTMNCWRIRGDASGGAPMPQSSSEPLDEPKRDPDLPF